ncbi:V protein [Parajeilongvirus brazilense]|nr:V protein [Diaemus bat paramyxovirus]
MSSNPLKEQTERVDNGLSAIEFIQRNKEEIQKTYGRSSITGPSTKGRVIAWEEFLETTSESSRGLEQHNASQYNTASNPGNGSDRDNGQSFTRSGISESSLMGSSGSRNNRAGDDKNDPAANSSGDSGYYSSSLSHDIHGRTFGTRIDEPEECSSESRSYVEPSSSIYEHQIIEGLKKNTGERQCAVVNDPVTPESMNQILNPEILGGDKLLKDKEFLQNIVAESNVQPSKIKPKKGIEENTSSKKHQTKSSSESGATQNAPQFTQNPDSSHAGVENAQELVRSVSSTSSI